jgi:excisionase family DNA binding protein
MSSMNSDSPWTTHEDGRVACSPGISDRLLDVKEAAALLKVPESWIYQHVRARAGEKLPHFKLGKYIRFSAKALMQWLDSHHLNGEDTSLAGQGRYSQFRG